MQRFAAFLVVFFSLFAATSSFALPAEEGSLKGVVADPSGARVVKATVTVQAEDGTTTAVQTGADGSYQFPQLAPGIYVITVTAPGLSLPQAQSLTVEAGRSTLQNLALIIAVDQQQITVTEQGAGLHTLPDNNAGAIVIKGKVLDDSTD